MSQHSYSLQKYSGVSSRFTCPSCGGKRCFSLYVDECGDSLNETVGRCDHESSCGYHYKPSDYFRDHPQYTTKTDWRDDYPHKNNRKPMHSIKPVPICTIPDEYVTRSVRPSLNSNLTKFLTTIIDPIVLECVIIEYSIGVTKCNDTIFFQIDKDGKCRTGKIMKYNPTTGHRIKDETTPNKITWVHSLLKTKGILPQEWTLTQCLFGEHLLPKHPDAKVALVESEKTAIICAALFPKYVWLATGGKTQLGDKLQILKGRKVIAFPDVDGYDTWKEKLSLITGLNIKVSEYLQRTATAQDKEDHIDIADLLLRQNASVQPQTPPKAENKILNYFSPEYRNEIEELIEELDLIPTSITRIST